MPDPGSAAVSRVRTSLERGDTPEETLTAIRSDAEVALRCADPIAPSG